MKPSTGNSNFLRNILVRMLLFCIFILAVCPLSLRRESFELGTFVSSRYRIIIIPCLRRGRARSGDYAFIKKPPFLTNGHLNKRFCVFGCPSYDRLPFSTYG